MWNPPALRLKWGPYFRDDVTEQAAIVTMTVAGKTAGIVTDQQAVEKLAPIYGTDDPEEVLKTLQAEAAERQKKALEQAQAKKPPPGAPQKDEGNEPE